MELAKLFSQTAPVFAGEHGLNRTKALLNSLHNPQNQFQTIHLAGTSGKTATSYLISQLLTAHDLKVGLHISPHLLHFNERYQLNQKPLPNKQLDQALSQIRPHIEKIKPVWGEPTVFELLTVVACLVFAQHKIDCLVLETGLGGLLDTTNVINSPNKLVVLTRIGLDHANILGLDISSIAAQKAGIISNHNTTITIPQLTPVEEAIKKTASNKHSQLIKVNHKTLTDQFGQFELGIAGKHQIPNAAAAITATSIICSRNVIPFNHKLTKKALKNWSVPGRFQILSKHPHQIILDVAHNPQEITALTQAFNQRFPGKKCITFFAAKPTKDSISMQKILSPISQKLITCDYNNLSLKQFHQELKQTKPELILATGSFALVRKVLLSLQQ